MTCFVRQASKMGGFFLLFFSPHQQKSQLYILNQRLTTWFFIQKLHDNIELHNTERRNGAFVPKN